jgi:hypothetical protein
MILLPPFKGTQVKSRRQVYLNNKEERVKKPFLNVSLQSFHEVYPENGVFGMPSKVRYKS